MEINSSIIIKLQGKYLRLQKDTIGDLLAPDCYKPQIVPYFNAVALKI